MAISSAQAIYGLNAAGIPSSTNVTGTVQIGPSQTQVQFLDADVAYSVRAVMAGSSSFVLDIRDATLVSSDAWVAGTAQVETATAAGTITLTGNASVTVTADEMTNTPKTISVAVLSGDTAAVWAGKVRTALAADVDVSDVFTVSGETTSIVLTRKSINTVIGPDFFPDNDTTINIALDNGTCTGITTASTSANTTAGVATFGCTIYDGDGKDFEGVTIPTIATLKAILFEPVHGAVGFSTPSFNDLGGVDASGIPTLTSYYAFLDEVEFTSGLASEIKITVIGKTA